MGESSKRSVLRTWMMFACLMGVASGAAHPQGLNIQEVPIPTAGSQPAVITQTGGQLFFVESATDRIGRSTAAGVVTDAQSRALFSGLDSIAPDPLGSLWFTESASSASHIVRVNTSLTSFSGGATAPPPVCTTPESRPRGITAGPDGNMWVVLAQCNAVLKFPPGFSPTAGSVYAVPTAAAGLARIAAGPDGALWFTESSANKIGRITTSGTVTEYPVPTAASGPHGITSGPDGALWFTEFDANKIGRIAADGTITEYPIPTAGSGPKEITWGSDGALWFTQFNANKIGRITTSGSITEFPVPTSGSGPNGITSGPGNTIWFTQFHGNQLGRFSVRPARGDFNRDGKSDVLWRNEATGENYLYPMNGTAIGPAEGYLRTVADTSWNIAGVGDFDGDGKADVLWRNSATGDNYIYLMSGTSIAGEGYVRTVADQAWQVAGTGDFDGDGKDDILWRNGTTGQNYVYPMDGLSIKAGEGFMRTVADLNWQVEGVADFDGDGRSDVLWRHGISGENYLYPMDGTTIKAGEGYLRSVADMGWQVKAVGDFDGDGKADIVWRHATTGENYLYPMEGTTIKPSEGYVRTVADLAWQIAASGDYDGDGVADLLWRNVSSGENYLYPMNGTAIKPGEGYLRTVAGADWRVFSGRRQQAPPLAPSVYNIDSPIQYTCAFGLVNLNISQFHFNGSDASLDVTGSPSGPLVAMQGSVTGTAFSVQGISAGSATETHTLMGTLSASRESWTGTYQYACTGSCLDCTNQSFAVTATRQ